MDYFFTEDQVMIRDMAWKIAEEKIKPVAEKYDESGEFPWDIMNFVAQADLAGVYIEEQYGGFGGGVTELSIVTEQFSRGCGGIAICFAATALGVIPITMFGTEEQKQKYLPGIASGKKLGAFGLTEANAGSDAGGLQTTADKDGDFYVLNGTKQWITNAGEAEVYTVLAMTDITKGPRGASCFIVEKGTEGFSFGKKENKMGIRASATRELIFENCRIPKENLLGREGQGFLIAMKNFDHSRPGVGAQAVGIAQGAMEASVRYAKERVQFGKTIASFQAIQHMIADMGTNIEAARALIYASARMIDSGAKKTSKQSAMAKLFAGDMAMKVTTDAVQIFGGYGYMKEYPVEKMMRDAKITQIYEGTNQIQRNIIASHILKEIK